MSGDVRKAVTGASIGNAVEWYDFAIYGFLATFIAANFFPSGNETAALLNTFAIFAAAWLAPKMYRARRRKPTLRAASSLAATAVSAAIRGT